MKRIVLLSVLSLVVFGCGPKPPAQPEAPASPPCGKEWVWTPPSAEDAFYGVGNASKATPSLAKQTATHRARVEIAQTCSVEVSSLVKDFMEQSGIGEGAQPLEFSQAVGKSVSTVTLAGSKIKDTCFLTGPGGSPTEYWVLVEYPVGKLREMSLDAAKQEAMREEAMYNEWKAEQGFEKLNEELAKLKGN